MTNQAHPADVFLGQLREFTQGTRQDTPELTGELLLRLGCTHQKIYAGPIGVSDDIDPLAHIYLTKILILCTSVQGGGGYDFMAMLAGICRGDFWKTCVKEPSGAHALAIAMLEFIESYSKSRINRHVKPWVLTTLNEWLSPAELWTAMPTAYVVCQSMFGDLWCDIALPASASEAPGSVENPQTYVYDLIYQQRPPFLPGLCPAQQESMSVPLPGLAI